MMPIRLPGAAVLIQLSAWRADPASVGAAFGEAPDKRTRKTGTAQQVPRIASVRVLHLPAFQAMALLLLRAYLRERAPDNPSIFRLAVPEAGLEAAAWT